MYSNAKGRDTQNDADFEMRLMLQMLSQVAQKKGSVATFHKHGGAVATGACAGEVEFKI